jgi:hypothetical protein
MIVVLIARFTVLVLPRARGCRGSWINRTVMECASTRMRLSVVLRLTDVMSINPNLVLLVTAIPFGVVCLFWCIRRSVPAGAVVLSILYFAFEHFWYCLLDADTSETAGLFFLLTPFASPLVITAVALWCCFARNPKASPRPVTLNCTKCQYRLQGLTGEVCPECGAEMSIDQLRALERARVDAL